MVEAVRRNISVVLNISMKWILLSKQRIVKLQGNEEQGMHAYVW